MTRPDSDQNAYTEPELRELRDNLLKLSGPSVLGVYRDAHRECGAEAGTQGDPAAGHCMEGLKPVGLEVVLEKRYRLNSAFMAQTRDANNTIGPFTAPAIEGIMPTFSNTK